MYTRFSRPSPVGPLDMWAVGTRVGIWPLINPEKVSEISDWSKKNKQFQSNCQVNHTLAKFEYHTLFQHSGIWLNTKNQCIRAEEMPYNPSLYLCWSGLAGCNYLTVPCTGVWHQQLSYTWQARPIFMVLSWKPFLVESDAQMWCVIAKTAPICHHTMLDLIFCLLLFMFQRTINECTRLLVFILLLPYSKHDSLCS